MTMTIGQLLDKQRTADPSAHVYFDFCNTTPTTVASWRGIYAEPAIGWAPTGYTEQAIQAKTVGELIAELEQAILPDMPFGGWKGGTYYYDLTSPLHVDNRGDCTNTSIVDVVDDEVYGVTIVTERKE
ncbi:MAG: hypothetical protein E6Q97_35740 [Desulfurellales bacterium]|nr:MAG: hypothetical protein E6Q97_35740 [Desulfurellales bacterium]